MTAPIPLKVGDIVAVVFVLLCAAATFMLTLGDGGADYVEIRCGGETLSYPLHEDRVLELESGGIALTVEIKGGSVRVLSSGCPDKECVHSAAISKAGGVIACVPAKTLIKITGKNEKADFIAG